MEQSNLIKAIAEQARTQPKNIAFAFLRNWETFEEPVSYSFLEQMGRQIGGYLQTIAKPGEPVILFFPPGREYIQAFVGILYGGMVPVPLYPPRPKEKRHALSRIIVKSGAKLAFCHVTLEARIRTFLEDMGSGLRLVTLEDIPPDTQANWVFPRQDPEDLALLQFTSGATGEPKGVMVTHRNLWENQLAITHAFNTTQADVCLSWLPPYHDMGLIGTILHPLYRGFPTFLISPAAFVRDPIGWLEAISRFKATISGAPNFAYELCCRSISKGRIRRLDLKHWRIAFNGAEPVRPATLLQFSQMFAPAGFRAQSFFPCYGMAEATLFISGKMAELSPRVQHFEEEALRGGRAVPTGKETPRAIPLVSCGQPQGSHRVMVVDPRTRRPRPPGHIGEIWFAGPSVTKGYWAQAELTASQFQARLATEKDGPFLRTGDLGFLLDDELVVTGRLKELIIIRGRNYYPQDIEAAVLESHAAVKGAAAFSLHRDGDNHLAIAVELKRGEATATAEEIIEILRLRISEEFALRAQTVVVLPPKGLPRTTSGKLRRRAIAKSYSARRLKTVANSILGTGMTADGVPDWDRSQWLRLGPKARREALTTFLRELVSRVLRVRPETIHPQRSLLTLGLDSLSAMELQQALVSRLGISIAMTDLLEGAHLASLAARVEAQSQKAAAPTRETGLPTDKKALSYNQMALWFLHQLAPEDTAYHLVFALWIRKSFDVEAFKRSLETLTNRHVSLRTQYVEENGVPTRLAPDIRAEILVIDPKKRDPLSLKSTLQREALRPFDLAKGPPLRVRLLRGMNDDWVLQWTVHHIAVDHWSLAILLRELDGYYRAFTAQMPHSLPTPKTRYDDFVADQARYLSEAAGERDWQYWHTRLANPPPLLSWPSKLPVAQGQVSSIFHFELPSDLTAALKNMSGDWDVTLFTSLISVFQIFLFKFTGCEEMLIGTPTTGRTNPAYSDLVGFLVNTLVLRTDLSDNPTLGELCLRNHQSLMDALNHQSFPFGLLVERLQPNRRHTRNPLFQVMFVLQQGDERATGMALGVDGAKVAFGGLDASLMSLDRKDSPFDLTLTMGVLGDRLSALFEYDRKLFDPETIREMSKRLVSLTAATVGNPNRLMSTVSLLTETEKVNLFHEWDGPLSNDGQSPWYRVFENFAATVPDRVAVVFGKRDWTYRYLNHRANAVAQRLLQAGLKSETTVAIFLERSPEMLAALIGIHKAGGLYLPLDVSYPRAYLEHALKDSGAAWMLTEKALRVRLPQTRALPLTMEPIAVTGNHVPHSNMTALLSHLIYTSGSTGEPKGVAITHQGVRALVSWAKTEFRVRELAGVFASTSLCFDLSVFEICASLGLGAGVVLAENALMLGTLDARERVSLLNTVPSTMAEWLRREDVPSSVRSVNLAGEPVRRELVERIYAIDHVVKVRNLYGPSETTTYSCFADVDRKGVTEPVIGYPLPHESAYLVDVSLAPLPPVFTGELVLGGTGLARGYHGRPDLTAAGFVPHPFCREPGLRLYRTGDLARRLPNGSLDFLGRFDDQIKLRGFRIEMGEIESRLRTFNGVSEAVVALSGPKENEVLTAFIVSQTPPPSTQTWRAFLTARLPRHMVPNRFVPLTRIPRLPNGKIDRAALRRNDTPVPEGTGLERPRSAIEAILVTMWESLLQREQISVRDHFFEMGGHSLLAARLISKIRHVFTVDLGVREIFEFPVLTDLAARIASKHPDSLPRRSIPVVGRQDSLPLSFAQVRLWFLEKLGCPQQTYQLAGAFRLEGPLHVPALERSLAVLTQRHEALRTHFTDREGEARQVISIAGSAFRLSLVADQRDGAWDRLEKRAAAVTFALDQNPLMMMGLLRSAPHDHLFWIRLHHLICDGWSLTVFTKELALCYRSFLQNDSPALDALPRQYADYSVWQRHRYERGDFQAQLHFWRAKLAGLPPLLELPTDRPRPAVQSYGGGTFAFSTGQEQSRQLKVMSVRENTSTFMILLAVFQVLLARYTACFDFAVGTPVANRDRREWEGVVGFFANTLALRACFSETARFVDLVKNVRSTVLEAYANQDLPFEQLVEELQPRRDLSFSPLFQVMFFLEENYADFFKIPGLGTTPLDLPVRHAKCDLTLALRGEAAGWSGRWEYNTDLFDGATAERLAGFFGNLLTSAMADPERAVIQLDMLSGREKKYFLSKIARTSKLDLPKRYFPHSFEQMARQNPDAIAFIGDDSHWSYSILNQKADRLAEYLLHKGLRPETHVGILAGRGPNMLFGILAVLKAGGGYVPMDPAYPEARLQFIAEDAHTSLVLTESSLQFPTDKRNVRTINLDQIGNVCGPTGKKVREKAIHPQNVAYLIYTSGSSGQPKGVVITHANTASLLGWATRFFQPRDVSGLLASTSICFDLSVFELFLPLSMGGAVIMVETIMAVTERFCRDRISMINTVPSAMEGWLALGEIPPLTRVINLAGEPLLRSLVRRILKLRPNLRIFNLYGPSEDTTYSTVADVSQQIGEPTIGMAIAGTHAVVLDEAMGFTPVGAAGELHLGGEGVSRGYYEQPHLTAENYLPDPFEARPGTRLYATGDRVRLLANGNLHFLGRRDQQVKIRGFRIEPGEIERALLTHEEVTNAVVVAKKPMGDTTLAAYLTTQSPTRTSVQEILAYLASVLPHFMIPASMTILKSLPRLPNGKIDRDRLPEPDTAAKMPLSPPRTETEKIIASFWCRILGKVNVGVHDSFFALGGHSLSAIRLVAQMRQRFQGVTLRSIFEFPTIAQMVKAMEKPCRGNPAATLGKIPRKAAIPLSFGQERLWFLDQMEIVGPAYHIGAGLVMNGPLDGRAAERSLGCLLDRHEIMRTHFVAVEGIPHQKIGRSPALSLAIADLAGLDTSRRREKLEELATRLARLRFHLERGPLYRFQIVKLERNVSVLLIGLHHIVSDAWTLGMLLREWEALYHAGIFGRNFPLPPLPFQFADYAIWQRKQWCHWTTSKSLGFWKETLAGAPGLLEFPLDRAQTISSFESGRYPLHLDSTLLQKLHHRVQAEGGTLFMLLLAAFQVLLARWCNQSDIVVGVPFANRDREPLSGLAGFLVNTLVMRAKPSPEKSFRDFFQEVREATLAAYGHGDFPFELLVEALNPARDLNRSPLFQAMFVLQGSPLEGMEPTGLDLGIFEADPGHAKFDLTLLLSETNGTIQGYLEYRRVLFHKTRIQRFGTTFLQIIHGLCHDFNPRLQNLPLHSAVERHLLLREWQSPGEQAEPRRSLYETFRDSVGRHSDAVACCSGEYWITFICLNGGVDRLAHSLKTKACAAGDRVAICLDRKPVMLAAMLGVLKLGAAYVPLDPDYPRARLAYLLEDSESRWVITGKWREKCAPTTVEAIMPAEDETLFKPGEPLCHDPGHISPHHMAYLIYTSGSMGKPKGVMIAHAQASAMLSWARRSFPANDVAGVLASTSICFDLSVFEIYLPFARAGTVILADHALALADLPARHAVTLINTVPSAMDALLRQKKTPRWVRVVNLAGEALDRSLVERIYRQTRVRAVYNLYGPSEDTTYSTHAHLAPRGKYRPPIGRPIDGTRAHVLDTHLGLTLLGAGGELFLGGIGLAHGYFRKPCLTASTFLPDPWSGKPGARLYRTGDLARYLGDGELDFLGRGDHQLKLRGYRIELGEIETVLNQIESVREAVVAARKRGRETILVGYVATSEDNPALLKKALETQLPHYLIPGAFVFLEALPRTPNGKIDRGALPDPVFSSQHESALLAPKTPLESQLAAIWMEVLDLKTIGIRQNFFDLGGHSLMAARVIARIRDKLGFPVTVQTMFEAPTIESLCHRLESLPSQPNTFIKPEPIPEPRPRDLPLSFGQERLWFLNQLEGASAAYHIPAAISLRGRLSLLDLERSIRHVVARHESLRTCFPAEGGGAFQRVIENTGFTLPIADVSGLDRCQARSAKQLIFEAASHPFSLEQGPLFRMLSLRLDQDSVLLSMTMHHIISDGWSVGILIREFGEFYQDFLRELPHSPAPLSLQYADYAFWQRRFFESGILKEQLDYWRRRLADAPPLLELPTDRPRSAMQSFKGKLIPFQVPGHLSARLRRFSSQEQVTPFMTLLAAYQILLARYAGQETVCVGTAVANRPWRELEGLIGFFFNTLVLRADLPRNRDMTVRDFLARVKESTLGAFTHQDVSFERVVEVLQPERNLSFSPLFQVMLLFQNMPQKTPRLPCLQCELVNLDIGVAKFEITLSLYEKGGAMEGHIEYNTDLFRGATIARLGRHYLELLQQMVSHRQRPIHALPHCYDAERQQLVIEWNQTETDYLPDRGLHVSIEECAAINPDSIALVCGHCEITYGAMVREANVLAQVLRRRGVKPGQLVGLCTVRSIDMVLGMLATLQAGGAYIPLDPAYPAERVNRIVEDAQPVLMLTGGLVGSFLTGACPSLDLTRHRETVVATAMVGRDRWIDDDNLAYLIYTSGSTGRPKGVQVTHRNALNLFVGLNRLLGFTGQRTGTPGVWLAVTSISFDISVLELLWTLTRGYRVIIQSERNSAAITRRTRVSALPRRPARPQKGLRFSLMYFAADEDSHHDKYRLLIEGARFADTHGFHAVWVPERHFHPFGGAFPNPAVAASAVAAITNRVRIRAGSVVLPLHHPIRVAEEWSMVDNISGGRVDLSIASGWHPHDFALAPGQFTDRYHVMWEGIKTLQALWRGEQLDWPTGDGSRTRLGIRPHPVQSELNLWITAAGNPRTFESAGRIGANVLTHFLGQNIRDLEDKIQIYRRARQEAGNDPREGRVTLMLHTFIGTSLEEVRRTVHEPFKAYLGTAFNLIQPLAQHLDLDPVTDRELILEAAFSRYFGTSSLFGTVDSCLGLLSDIEKVGVNEIACLIDFGVPEDEVLAGLQHLKNISCRVATDRVATDRVALDRVAKGRADPDRIAAGVHSQGTRPTIHPPAGTPEPYLPPEELMIRHRVTHLQGTPTFLSLLAKGAGGREGLSRLKLLLVGGENLSTELAEQLIALGPEKIYNMYGPTETTVWSSSKRVIADEAVSIGRPLANTRTHVLDFGLRAVPLAVTGELFIGGIGLARGYQGQPAMTATRFLPDPISARVGSRLYRTGDLARYDLDGQIDFLGRTDHQVKIRGYRIELGELESLLDGHPAVEKSVAWVHEHDAEDRRLVVHIRPKPRLGSAGLTSQLRDFLKAQVPEYMLPGQFYFVDSLPLTPNGKIDRRKLKDVTLEAGTDAPAAPAASPPRGETETRLAALWKEFLKLEHVDSGDNFFELGGHSMLVPRLHGRLNEEFGNGITIADIFKYGRLSELAAYLDSLGSSKTVARHHADELVERQRQRAQKQLQALRERRKLGKVRVGS